MPRAHHAALSKKSFATKSTGVGRRNTVAQINGVSEQLRVDGVRVLDTRVLLTKAGQFKEAHGSLLNRRWYGCTGSVLEDVVHDINKFTEEYPGELIIWDFHSETWSQGRGYKPLTPLDRENLYKFLFKVNNRAVLPKGDDITKMPLKDLIGNGQSAVIIRFDSSWLDATPDTFPPPREGFVHGNNFPRRSTWSEQYSLDKMSQHQIRQLMVHRCGRDAGLYDMQWLRTLTGITVVTIPDNFSLIDMGRASMTTLRTALWNNLTDQIYPNWLTVDAIDGGELRALAIAMNRCFAARQCGDWVKHPR